MLRVSGMTSRDFKGFPSLQEVECTGQGLKSDVKLIALLMYSLPNNDVMASMNVISKDCVTFGKFSSCEVNVTHPHRSKLRLLVADLEEGERREYKCTANTYDSLGLTKVFSWTSVVQRVSEYFDFAILICFSETFFLFPY